MRELLTHPVEDGFGGLHLFSLALNRSFYGLPGRQGLVAAIMNGLQPFDPTLQRHQVRYVLQ